MGDKIELILFNKRPQKDGQGLSPEAEAVKIYSKLIKRQSENDFTLYEILTNPPSIFNPIEYLSYSSRDSDPVHGEYPFLIYKHHYILKNDILSFCSHLFQLNKKMSMQSLKEIQYLESLLVDHLHVINKLNKE